MAIVNIGGKNVYMENYLVHILNQAKKMLRDDWDMVFLVDGMEGSGKSVLAQQVAAYVDEKFSMDDVVFRHDKFTNWVLKAEKYRACVFDEARAGLAARNAMTNVNKALTDMLAEIRQKNLFIIVVLPSIFDLDRNVALWRSRVLLHTRTYNGKRGFYNYYGRVTKNKLYIKGKKDYSYFIKPDYRGRFVKFYPLNEQIYREKKLENLRALSGNNMKGVEKRKERLMKFLFLQNLNRKREKYHFTAKAMGEFIGISGNTVMSWLNLDEKDFQLEEFIDNPDVISMLPKVEPQKDEEKEE